MTPDWVWLIFVTVVGANVGSFLNVVIYRLPAGMSVVHPPSRCPRCEARLAWYDNVPVLGWLWLRGKCRACKDPISVQYPVVEALVALLFGGTYALLMMSDFRPPFGAGPWAGIEKTWPVLVVLLVLLAGLFAATVIDARHYIIPLEIPWVITATALIGLPLAAWRDPEMCAPAGVWLSYEPYLPVVGHRGAFIAWGGAAGLVVSLVLRRVGIVPDSFEGEDDIEIEPPHASGALADANAGSGLSLQQRVVVLLAPAAFVVGVVANAFLQIGQGQLPGKQLHVVAGGVAAYLVARVGVLVWQLTAGRKAGAQGNPEDAEDQEDDVPPLKHPRLVVLKECFFVAFPLLGMLAGYFLASQVWIEPWSTALWYDTLGGVVLGYLVGGGVIWAIRILGTMLFGKEAMGMGDIHLLAGIGAVIGWWESVFLCIFIAPFLGLAVILMTADMSGITRRQSSQVPYGPYLAVAAALIVLLGMGRMDLFGVLESLQPPRGTEGFGPRSLPFVP